MLALRRAVLKWVMVLAGGGADRDNNVEKVRVDDMAGPAMVEVCAVSVVDARVCSYQTSGIPGSDAGNGR